MEFMDNDFKNILMAIQTKDSKFEEYVDAKCIEAISECEEYIKNEYSGKYTEQELSVMRERLIFKKAWISAWKLAFECMPL